MSNFDKIKKIFEDEEISSGTWKGDNTWQGLKIISKYIDPMKKDLIRGADHDIIYSVDLEEIVEKGLTIKDAKELRRLNWILEDDYLACFV